MSYKKICILLLVFVFQSHFVMANDALKTPAYSSQYEIKKWASEIVAETLSFNHQNYTKNLTVISSFYTENGWESFSKDLRKSRLIETVEYHKATLKSFQYDSVLVCHTEEKETSYSWYVIVPIRSILYNEEDKFRKGKNVLIHANQAKKEAGTDTQIFIEEWMGSEDDVEPSCELYVNLMEIKKLDVSPEVHIKAAEQGNADAQYMLGQIYAKRKNLEKSFYWYKMASEQSHSLAQEKLAFFYIDGSVVEKSLDEAKKWLQKSAELGNESAKSSLELFGD